MCRKPVITAPAHSGMAILRFMDSWVVGVNVCGKRPRRFVDPINMIRETIIRVHVRPFGVWISIICLIISLTSQCWKEWRRLLIRRFEDGNRIEGNIMMATTIGNPIIVGVMNEANRFSFILILKGFLLLWLREASADIPKVNIKMKSRIYLAHFVMFFSLWADKFILRANRIDSIISYFFLRLSLIQSCSQF